ncbi:hypothetical protein [Undibacterium curvum]|uniref:hypothetical protein n=1 Tax=Undibacterium curvum TaxID=2762294 RepID=UPI003D0CF5D0
MGELQIEEENTHNPKLSRRVDNSGSTSLSAKAVQHRAAELLAQGTACIDVLGRRSGNEANDAFTLLEAASAHTGALLEVNMRLVPLMSALQRQGSKYHWLRWFTGKALEQDVFIDKVRNEIDELAHKGQQSYVDMVLQIQNLAAQQKLMHTEIALLEAEIAAAKLLASPAFAQQRALAGIHDDELTRLIRRIDNLGAMATATQLTEAQFKVAIDHAKSVADRYREIRTLLLPIWKQSLGFDLFSRRVSNQLDQGK